MRAMDLPDGGIKVLTQGVVRARAAEIAPDQDILRATIQTIPFEQSKQPEGVIESKIKKLAAMGERVTESAGFLGADFQAILSQMEDPERMITFILSHINLRVDQAQELLEQINKMLAASRQDGKPSA